LRFQIVNCASKSRKLEHARKSIPSLAAASRMLKNDATAS
jgi:hypothetical protein